MSSTGARRSLVPFALALFAGVTAIAGTAAGLGVPATATPVAAPAAQAAAVRAPLASLATMGDVGGVGESGEAGTLEPAFLTADQMPLGERYGTWKRTGSFAGVPAAPVFCLDSALPAEQTRYVAFRGKKAVSAQQFVTLTESAAAAADLVSEVGSQIAGCYQQWLDLEIDEYREGKRSASWKRYGGAAVEDGITFYGVFTVPPKGFARTTHLYAVGRDGSAVVVVHLAMLGPADNAPDKAFRKVTKQALAQAF
ncbi:MAG: hypothetical protein ACT4PP_03570 [Sporichthyaceae bacterium]